MSSEMVLATLHTMNECKKDSLVHVSEGGGGGGGGGSGNETRRSKGSQVGHTVVCLIRIGFHDVNQERTVEKTISTVAVLKLVCISPTHF